MTKDRANKVQTPQEDNLPVRKSCRLTSLPKNDYYLMGSGKNLDIYGIPQQQEVYTRKRPRKNYRYDDSEDFQFTGRHPTKKLHLFNKVQALLKQKQDVRSLPIHSPHQSRVHKVKTLANENLTKFGADLQAIFINIDWDKKGQSLQDFQKLKIESTPLMRKGMLFVWAPKQKLSEIVYILEQKHFSYVENFEIINFDRDLAINLVKKPAADSETNSIQNGKKTKSSKKSEPADIISDHELIKKLSEVQPTKLITQKKKDIAPYFNQSKKTLLLFRKQSNEKIELRHQRTCDVVFDLPSDPKQKCKGYIRDYVFKMIQTLLPKGIQEENIERGLLKMMELWGQSEEQRRGWIHVNQK